MIGLRVAVKLLGIGALMLRHEGGRRLLAALVLTAGCAGVIGLLFAAPEPLGAWTGQLTEANASPARPATVPPTTMPRATPRPSPRPAEPTTTSPTATAKAWYARRHKLPLERVRVLQADKVDTDTVRVLVMAERGGGRDRGRLDTAVVTVTRNDGRWRVHQ
jgi:hypothetical protein